MTTKKQKQVDTTASLTTLVAQLGTLLDQANEILGAHAPVMSTAAKRRVVKAPPGCEPVISTVSRLVERYGVALPNHSGAAMTAALESAQALAPVVEKTQLLLAKVGAASLSATGQAWGSATAYYSAMNRVKGTDAELTKALAPLSEFFSKHAKKKKAASKRKAVTNASGNGATINAAPAKGATATAASANGASANGTSATHAASQ